LASLNLQEGDTTTTVAIGKDTYTIVTHKKDSTAKKGAEKKMVTTNKEEEHPSSGHTNENGDTIRIFRRSRSGRPTSAQSTEVLESQDDKLLRTEDLPAPDTIAGVKEANAKLKQLICHLQGDAAATIDNDMLVSNLEYVSDVVSWMSTQKEDEAVGDDLSELQSEAVPEEVRKWLASTFAKQETAPRRRGPDERPTFRSVANAIRTGIFIEKIYRRMSSSQLMAIPPDIHKALKGVDNWNFDTFALHRVSKGTPLRYLGYELLTRHGCLHKYKVPPSMLEAMLNHVEAGYTANGNPYHNNMHACDVLQTTHYFISQTGLANWMSDLEIFTSLMAAIIHDFDHTGTTNNFHINSGSGLATLYNDRAVLENHHVSAFFRLIKEHDCNIFANMQKTDFRDFRNLIIDMVLHTDMSQHFSQLKAMKTMIQQNSGESSFDKTKVLCLMLHSCDVSHPAKRWGLHHRWTARCMEEFFVQGDREKELGLEYSPLCDRHNTMVPQSQIGFIDYIVSPTLTVIGDSLDLILGTLDIPPNARPASVPENRQQPQSHHSSTASSNSASGNNLLNRPWADILTENRAKWQKKHDAGEKCIEFDQMDRPSSASTTATVSRPSTATSTVDSQNVFMQARVRLPDDRSMDETDPEASTTETGTGTGSTEGTTTEAETTSASTSQMSVDEDASKKQPYKLQGSAPDIATKLEDVVDELPDHVLSRSGTPSQWAFDDKDTSLKTSPPRPTSATLCSPPVPRKVPISVDHHLRK
jgi:calcium/calmodulin-dependent 3',5'-cyclic nucleotide phosphodiesterase